MSGDTLPFELRLAGYFPKRIAGRLQDDPPAVVDICSVSHCISQGPDGWIDHWLHNALGFFDSPDTAGEVIAPLAEEFTILGFNVGTIRFRVGRPELWTWPDIDPEPRPRYYALGFDVVGAATDDVSGFDHSPLSCNGLAQDYPVNAHCLFDDLAAALAAAERFSVEQPEPGLYYVVEVLARR